MKTRPWLESTQRCYNIYQTIKRLKGREAAVLQMLEDHPDGLTWTMLERKLQYTNFDKAFFDRLVDEGKIKRRKVGLVKIYTRDKDKSKLKPSAVENRVVKVEKNTDVNPMFCEVWLKHRTGSNFLALTKKEARNLYKQIGELLNA